jgi:hypothetical protein
MSTFYEGRLETDGYGNLLASEGDKAGFPVAFHEGNYVYLNPGEASHNDRNHKQFAGIVGTQSEDPDAPGYVDENDEDNQHHFFNPVKGEPSTLSFHPDAIAPRVTSHTAAISAGSTSEEV